jgi:hypothetical protein
VRKLVLYFCLAGAAFGQTPQPTDTVLAWKPQTPYMHGGSGWPSMPHNLWTNSVLWLTAESPVLNAGETNANWICYAKTCTGNATQTVVNSQPLRVFTNGVWVLRFDGTDDRIGEVGSVVHGSTNFTISARVDLSEIVGNGQIYSEGSTSSVGPYLGLRIDEAKTITFHHRAGVGVSYGRSTTNTFDGVVNIRCVVRDQTNVTISVNGVNQGLGSPAALGTGGTPTTHYRIGNRLRQATADEYYKGNIHWVEVTKP